MEAIETLRGYLKGKVDDYEIYLTRGKTLTIEVKDGKVDSFDRAETEGVGLRVLKDRKMGFSFTSSLEDERLRRMADRAIESALNTTPDEYYGFPEKGRIPSQELHIYDPSLLGISEKEKIEKAIKLERSARAFDHRVKKVRKASYKESIREVVLAGEGWMFSYPSTRVSGGIVAIAEDKGDSQMGWDWENGRTFDGVDPDRIGRRAAERAVRLLGARAGRSMKVPVVIESQVVAEFLEILSSSFLADNLHKGKSMLRGKVGQTIFSTSIDVVDDGILPGGWFSSPFDGEGTPRRKTVLIEKGTLKGYLYDYYWARKEGRESTGNSSRASFKAPPSVSYTNLYIPKGSRSITSILKEMGEGVLITDLLGAHTANPVTGEFSFGAMGLWIEGGRIAYPLKGIAISGNLLEIFKGVVEIGEDLRFFGGIGAPSLLVEVMEISG